MRKAFIAILLVGMTTSFAKAQNNSYDDVYYRGSDAKEDAKQSAKKQKSHSQQQSGVDYYNSTNGNYNDAYIENSYEDDSYIDYDDDSYTSRIRRFHYPMMGMGYWGGVYSPFWCNPFYYDPFWSWGGWYTPRFGMSFGMGPYWNNYWGMSTWYGYGGFGYWGNPYWGGMGYGNGFWNGYYAGFNDGWNRGGYYNNGFTRRANYGPRGMSAPLNNQYTGGRVSRTGNYVSGRTRVADNGMVTPDNARSNNFNRVSSNRVENGNINPNNNRTPANTGRDNNNGLRVNPDASGRNMSSGNQRMESSGTSRGFFNNRSNNNTSSPSRNSFNQSAPSQNSYNRQSAPSNRGFSSPSPSRSSGGSSFGGGSRSGGSSGGFGGGSRGGSRGR